MSPANVPFDLDRERRFIALTAALRHLDLGALAHDQARALAYEAADLLPVDAAEDAEARRRSALYWRRIRPRDVAPAPVPPPLAPTALEPADA